MNLITKDFYKADVFRFDIEDKSNIVDFTVNNAISWDILTMRLTKDELRGLADFIYGIIEEKK